MTVRARSHPLWLVHLLHRLSGVALALFLPLHFLLLAQALNGADAMDAALAWTDYTIVKLAEFGLVFCLAVHLFGGLRLLAMDWLPWTPRHKTYAAAAIGAATLTAGSFFLQVI